LLLKVSYFAPLSSKGVCSDVYLLLLYWIETRIGKNIIHISNGIDMDLSRLVRNSKVYEKIFHGKFQHWKFLVFWKPLVFYKPVSLRGGPLRVGTLFWEKIIGVFVPLILLRLLQACFYHTKDIYFWPDEPSSPCFPAHLQYHTPSSFQFLENTK